MRHGHKGRRFVVHNPREVLAIDLWPGDTVEVIGMPIVFAFSEGRLLPFSAASKIHAKNPTDSRQ